MNSVRHGVRDGYGWVWSQSGRLSRLLEAVPELVLGHVVAITGFDSGPFKPNAQERAAGWVTRADIAFSPPVTNARALPLAGWDEWYVLESQRTLPELHVFVNCSDFTPSPEPVSLLDPTWDRVAAEETQRCSCARADWFWHQLLSVRPRTFLAEGQALTCVTMDVKLLPRVLAVVGGAANY